MKNGLKILAVIFVVFLGFGIWYKLAFSMKVAEGYEVNDPTRSNSLFIATQGSTFKDHLVKDITNDLKDEDLYIKVADVGELSGLNTEDWDAIVILHTWEMQRPPKAVGEFIENIKNTDNIVVFATSGSGEDGMEEVDGITGASVISELEGYKIVILERIRARLE